MFTYSLFLINFITTTCPVTYLTFDATFRFSQFEIVHKLNMKIIKTKTPKDTIEFDEHPANLDPTDVVEIFQTCDVCFITHIKGLPYMQDNRIKNCMS